MRWGRCAAAVAVGVLGIVLVQQWDVAILRWRGTFMPVKPCGFWDQILLGFQDFPQVLSAVTIVILVAAYDRRRANVITAIVLGQILGLVGYNAGKILVARYRPYYAIEHVANVQELKIEQTWLGWQPGIRGEETKSFPSGHSAGAFALAGVLAWFYPRIRWLLWTLAVGCAASRALQAWHWPSDCVVGAAVGYLAGQIALAIVLRTKPGR